MISQCMPELPDREDVEIALKVEHDADLPVRGNVQASGDDTADRAAEAKVLNRIANGDVWAWACVTVVGRWRGYEAAAVLGGCSYESEEQFRADPYFEDLVSEVVDKIQQEADLRQRLDHIEERTRQLAQAHDATAVRNAIDRMLDVYKYVVRAEPHNR